MRGICDVRYEIYDEAFNELIRQVAINCPERGTPIFVKSKKGLLLMKVRDELKIGCAAYKALYESSVVFGVRKQVQAEEGVKEMENKIKDLERQKKILDNYVSFPTGYMLIIFCRKSIIQMSLQVRKNPMLKGMRLMRKKGRRSRSF